MKLSNKEQKELEILLWFADDSSVVTDSDIKKFFDYSSRGIGKDDAQNALLAPKKFNKGFVELMLAKRNRETTVKMWMESWGDTLNAWSFLDEPQHIVEWIAKTLDREAITMAWHEERYKWWNPFSWRHRKLAESYRETINSKDYNKPLAVRRTK